MINDIKYFYLIVIIFVLQGCSDDLKNPQFQLIPSLDEGTNYTCKLSEELLVINNFDTLVNSIDSSTYYLVYEKQIDTTFNYVFKIIYLDTNMFKYNILESIRNVEFEINIDSIGNLISIHPKKDNTNNSQKDNLLLTNKQLMDNLYVKTNYFFNVLYNCYWQNIDTLNSIIDTTSIPLLSGENVKGQIETIVVKYIKDKYIEILFRTSHKSSNFSFLDELEYHIDLSKMLTNEIKINMKSIENNETTTMRREIYKFDYYDE